MDKSSDQTENTGILPVQIAQGIYLVGKNDKEQKLKCNPYLIIENDEAVLIDPGSVLDFAEVFKNVCSIISPDKITLIIAQHQDPDLCGSIPLFYGRGVNAPVALHWRTSVIIRHYGIENSLYIVNENKWIWKFRSGRTLRFLPAPYCHFAGSIMTYDEESRTVFSGDLFGSLVYSEHVYADETYRNGMDAFHEHYMPSHAVLMPVMDLLLELQIDRIAPQHGCIIKDNVESFIKELRQLECGSFSGSISGFQGLPAADISYNAFLNEILDRLSALFSADKVYEMFRDSAFELDAQTVHIVSFRTNTGSIIDLFFQTIADRNGIRWITVIEPFARTKLRQYRFPLPAVFSQNGEETLQQNTTDSDTEDLLLYDALTGLYNKAVFLRFVEITLTRNNIKPFVVMYFSVDSSLLPPAEETVQNKETVLKSFAYILRNAASRFVSLRVFRLENDDFACIVENTDERKAQLILEDIRQSVKLSGFFAKGTCVPAAVLSSRTIQEIPMAPAADTIYEILLQMIEIAKKKGPDGICDSFQKELLKSRKNQIVLLEPDTTYINFLLPHFKQEGYELKIYRSGKELSSAVDYFMPDLFIAEAMAPQFNGFELREKLLKIPEGQTKPFILVSLRKDEEFILRAAELGILFFLRKPFSREELFGLVDNLLR